MKGKTSVLNDRHRRFVKHYVINFNGAEAYRKCYPDVTKPTSQRNAIKLLAKPEVQALIEEETKALRNRLNLSQDAIVVEQLRIGMSDIRNYLTWDDTGIKVKSSDELSDDESRAIESIECRQSFDQEGQQVGRAYVKLKLHNKSTALESLAKHLGLYIEKHAVHHTYGSIEVPALASPDEWDEMVKQQVGYTNGSHSGTDAPNLDG